MPIIEFLKTSDNTYPEVSATNPLPTTSTISGGTVTADTELPSAALLANASAVPTTPTVGSVIMASNGSTIDMLQVDSNKFLKVVLQASTNIFGVLALASSGSGMQSISGTADASAGTQVVSSGMISYNGATFDKVRNNTQNTLLASSARTVTTSSADQTNYNSKGLHVVLDVTSAGTGSITLSIEAKDTLSGKYYTLLTGAAVTTDSTNVYKVYPGLPATANVSANDIVPRTYRVTVTANNANSVTYSVASLHVL